MKNPNLIKYLRKQTWDDKAYQIGQLFYACLIAIGIEIMRRVYKELDQETTEQTYYYYPPNDTSNTVAWSLR